MVWAVKRWNTVFFYRTHDCGEHGDDDDEDEYDVDNDERKSSVPAHVWPCLRMGVWSKSIIRAVIYLQSAIRPRH